MRLALGFLLCICAALGHAQQQYRWLDEKGRVHYTDTPPPPSAKSVRKESFKGNTVGAQPNLQLQRALASAPVKLYTHLECAEACRVARQLLNRRGIPFEEISAASDEKIKELKAVSGALDVPILVVGDYVERDAAEQTYEAALDRAGYAPRGVVRPREE